jgi:hypothetical protein
MTLQQTSEQFPTLRLKQRFHLAMFQFGGVFPLELFQAYMAIGKFARYLTMTVAGVGLLPDHWFR